MMGNFKLEKLYDCKADFAKYKILTFQLNCFIKKFLNKISLKLERFNIDIELFCLKWFFSMYTIDLPISYVLIIYDLYLF